MMPRPAADLHKLEYESVFRGITLAVHSSLDAVGFTAAVASKLAALDIPANVIGGFLSRPCVRAAGAGRTRHGLPGYNGAGQPFLRLGRKTWFSGAGY